MKFQNHPSIMKIRSKFIFQEKSYFKPFPVKYVENIIKNIPNNKGSGEQIPPHVFKQSGCTYQMLTDCINDALSRSIYFQIT